MESFPPSLQRKLEQRRAAEAFRTLGSSPGMVDFSSNDYLGLARHQGVHSWATQMLEDQGTLLNGSGGSRLLTGNHIFYQRLEQHLQHFFGQPALVFNSGYDANTGFLSAVPQRGDLVFYDEYSHASIRDGLRLGLAKAVKFPHNDLEALEGLLQKQQGRGERYIITEAVFSMDGDSPDLQALCALAGKYQCRLVIDEAHSLGVRGASFLGMVQSAGLQEQVFARILTFGKAIGAHGAAVVGSQHLKDYLLNFARSFVYTTGLPPHSVTTLIAAFQYLATESGKKRLQDLRENITYFREYLGRQGMERSFLPSDSAIHSCILPGNTRVRQVAEELQREGLDVRPVLSPTVPEGQERLRFCLHSHNNRTEIREVLEQLAHSLLPA